MYAALPRMIPATVPSEVIVGETAESVRAALSGAIAFASPKSSTFTGRRPRA
jgi:hypothetical protein